MELKNKTIGAIVAENFATADIFRKYGIDFCCHGNVDFEEACAKAQVSIENISKELESANGTTSTGADFSHWPYDLLIDYVLKIHHRGIRREGPNILRLLDTVVEKHGATHPELAEVRELFEHSLQDLDLHLSKEENVLFPYLYRLFEAADNGLYIEPIHCGSVSHPIEAMMADHSNEGERYKKINQLTNNYRVPEDACNGYKLLLSKIKLFEINLNEHIHLENNIIFPAGIRIEKELQND